MITTINTNGSCPKWQSIDWSTYHDPKRDTENDALRSLKTQVNLIKRLDGRNVFSPLEEKVFLLERGFIASNCAPDIAKYKIAEILNVSLTLIERVLFTCTLIMYYREYVGLPPLIY